MSNYTPPTGDNNGYLNQWGNQRAERTADAIDHIADKAGFGLDMIATALGQIDAIEKELIEWSTGPTPPAPQVLRALAHRLDAHQKQIQEGLQKVRVLMKDIDHRTDDIQRNNTWR